MAAAGKAIMGQLAPGSAGYSLLFGAAWGIGISGLVWAGRGIYIAGCDHDYYKNQSRQR
jgi:hypothetical protein